GSADGSAASRSASTRYGPPSLVANVLSSSKRPESARAAPTCSASTAPSMTESLRTGGVSLSAPCDAPSTQNFTRAMQHEPAKTDRAKRGRKACGARQPTTTASLLESGRIRDLGIALADDVDVQVANADAAR